MPAPEANPARSRRFLAVLRYYRALHEGWERSGRPLYRDTSLGAWAGSRPEHLYYFFRRVGLARYRLFIDLGSGDGLAACLASLFTRAIGIEIDPDLCRTARTASVDLGLHGRAEFVCGDFLGQSITRADCLFIYPDKPIHRLEPLLTGWRGTLLVYGPHLPAQSLTPRQRLACGRERLTRYAARPE